VHERVAFGCVHELAPAEPVEELVSIVCLQYFIERVATMGFAHARRNHEQMEIVIAEHGNGTRAELSDEAQCFERLGAAVDEIADEPENVTGRVERDAVEQAAQLIVAALDVTDRVSSHA
jgi:hypothetical protein